MTPNRATEHGRRAQVSLRRPSRKVALRDRNEISAPLSRSSIKIRQDLSARALTATDVVSPATATDGHDVTSVAQAHGIPLPFPCRVAKGSASLKNCTDGVMRCT